MLRKLIMFFVSYIPLYIFLMILKWRIPYNLICGKTPDMTSVVFYGILLTIFFISICFLVCFKFIDKGNSLTFDKLHRPDDTVISYIFTYIVPILSLMSGGLEVFIVNILLFFMVAILYVRMELFYINPILTFFGYITYSSDKVFILSDIPYNDLLLHKKNLPGCYIANGIFLAKKKYLSEELSQ